MDGQEVLRRANSAVSGWTERANQFVDAGNKTEAKKMLVNAQRELRALKAEVVAEEREVRASFTESRLKTNQAGQTVASSSAAKAAATWLAHVPQARAASLSRSKTP